LLLIYSRCYLRCYSSLLDWKLDYEELDKRFIPWHRILFTESKLNTWCTHLARCRGKDALSVLNIWFHVESRNKTLSSIDGLNQVEIVCLYAAAGSSAKVQQRWIRLYRKDSGMVGFEYAEGICQPLHNISSFIVANVITGRDSPVAY